MPDQSRPFQIKADASKYASGAVLMQMDSNSDRHLVAYFSKTFHDTERNYEIYDRELLESFVLLKNGGIIFKDQDTQPLHTQTIRI